MEFKGNLMLVYNPAAGKRTSEKVLSTVCCTLTGAGWQVTVFPTFKTGDGKNYVKQYGSSFDRIVAMGGDGTLNEAVSGMLDAGFNVPVGYIPAGSTNDFATTHGIPSDAEKAAMNAAGDNTQELDVARFGDRYVLFHGACGSLSGVVNETPQDVKNQLGYVAYILDGMKDAATFRPVHVKFTLPDQVVEGNYIYGGLINTNCLGGGIVKLPLDDVTMDDGIYELLLVEAPKDLIEFGEMVNQVAQGNFNEKRISFRNLSECRIDWEEDPQWGLDGEKYTGGSGVQFKVIQKAIKLIKNPC